MARFKLHRRAVLRGTSGAALALPFLEIMGEGKARAAVAPRRFVFCYAGVSLTRDSTPSSDNVKFFTPGKMGAGYDLGPELSPLGKQDRTNRVRTIKGYGVQDEVSIVSGLKIPYAEQGQTAPADGRAAQFHGSTLAPLTTGTTKPSGPSADQIIAEAVGKGTRFPTGVQYQIQPAGYEGASSQRANICYRRAGTRGLIPMGFYNSGQQIFAQLFGTGFTPVNDADAQAQKRAIQQDKSILDLVLRRGDSLKAALGKGDRMRLEQHFDEVRALEKRVVEMPMLSGSAACMKLPDPGPDPKFDPAEAKNSEAAGGAFVGWSEEIKRGEVMRDLMTMALTCDLTRVGVLLITYAQSYMSAERLCGVKAAVHGSGHGAASTGEFADILAWHVEQFAALVRKLKDTPDVDGRPMIDNTIVALGTEGGYGYDPEIPDPVFYPSTHSSENMNMLVGGGRNLGLNPGRHLAKNNQVHPASVLVSAMKACGVDQPLGNVKAAVDDL